MTEKQSAWPIDLGPATYSGCRIASLLHTPVEEYPAMTNPSILRAFVWEKANAEDMNPRQSKREALPAKNSNECLRGCKYPC